MKGIFKGRRARLRLANSGPQAKSKQPSVFINKGLLEHSDTHLFTDCPLCSHFHTTVTGVV